MNEIQYDKVGILIAVRMKSSRLSKKAFGDIAGKPLIVHLIDRMKRVRNKNKIILCTSTHPEDQVLMDVAEQENVGAYAGSELDVMSRFIEAAENNNVETIVRVTGDNPLTDPDNIDQMIEAFYKGKYDFVKSEYLPLGVNAEVVSLSTLKKAHEMALDTNLTEYMTSYLKRPDIFKIHTHTVDAPIFNNRSNIRLTVDFKEDLDVMNEIYGELYHKDKNFGITEVLEVLDKRPEILDINDNMLEIPLPKIQFKGQVEYDKKLVAVIDSMGQKTSALIDKISDLHKYNLTGFLYSGDDFQYTLIDNIPILGKSSKIDEIKIDAEYFYIDIDDEAYAAQIANELSQRGFKEIKI